MNKIRLFLISVFTLFNTLVSCQNVKSHHFINDADKVIMSTVYFKDKTTEPQLLKKDSTSKLYYPIETDIKESITKTGFANLNKEESKKLISLLKEPSLGHALPYQYDIQLDLYKNNKVVQIVTISSQTKNLVIKKVGCKTHIDENGQEIAPCIFRGMVSENLKKYIVSLLKSKKLWNNEQQFMEDYK
ncbi:hypothetical protein [Chryseobacterium bernardetii]|uniref:hypothetical protein n=1 Tax=Chryseobacterium bernardetii TaxID=1241978 RepID=UPI003AF495F2